MKCPYCNKEFSNRDAKIRSTPENKYYWGVPIEILSNELGYTKDEMHELLKSMFLKDTKMFRRKDGKMKKIEVVKSTASLSVPEFEEYLSNIRVFASMELQINIPEPNEKE